MEEGSDRRRFARVFFTPPLSGKFAGTDVEVLDLNTLGATVLARQPLMLRTRGHLSFPYRSKTLMLPCEVTRNDVSPWKNAVTGKNRLHSVLVFENLDAEARKALEAVLAVELENLQARPDQV